MLLKIGTSDGVVYDELGRIGSKTDQANKTTQFTYDSMGRLTKVKDALNQETTYGYNEFGQQISQTDATVTRRGLTMTSLAAA